jgi:hypothetical protein
VTENRLDYTNYSFDSAVAQLVDKLKEADAWKDTYQSSNGQVMIDLLAYVMNLVMYSMERRAEESYLDTSRLRSSIIKLVTLLDYKIDRPVSSIGVIRVSIPSTLGYDVYIPKWTIFQSLDGYKFLASQDYYLTAGTLYVDVNVIQGVKGELTITSSGLENQSVNIPFTSVENTSIILTVDSVVWSETDTFLNSVGTDLVYTVVLESDDTVTVHFGNNVQGKVPDLNSSIYITYVKSDGDAGNVYASGQIVTIVDNIYDTNGSQITNAIVNNSGTLLGAADAESTEHIRYYAPKLFAAGQRAVTKDDFIALIAGYSGVADAVVWGERENGLTPDYDQFNRINICVILQGWLLPDSAFKTILGNYLYDSSLLTVKYEFTDFTILDIIAAVDLFCQGGTDLSQIRASTTYALQGLFDLGNTTKLGQKKYLSDLNKAINDISGVSYSHVTMKIQKAMVWNSGTSRWELTLPQLTVKPGSVEILVNGVVLAYDDGFNVIKTTPGGSLAVTGQVDYTTTGYSWVQISSSPQPSQVLLRYQQPDGDITPTTSKICRLYAVEYGTVSQ